MSAKMFIGQIVSDKMQKTCVVQVEMPKKHPLYGKMVKNTCKFMARNDLAAKLGDTVVIKECPKFSKKVSFMVMEVK
jgi:small subunit ribosomal protein S17